MGDLVAGVFPGAKGGWPRRRRLWWLLWSGCPGLGSARLRQLETAFGSLSAAWRASGEQLLGLPGLGRARVAQIEAHRRRWGPDPWATGSGALPSPHRVLLPGDPSCPPALARLERPPLALYWSGCGATWPLLRDRLAIAVVGTRRASLHGLSMARALGAALARAGWPVVSGLAEGIDAAVHQGCLAAGGRPVAVLGTPLERVYPRHHGQLQAAVAAGGLLVSELAPGAAVARGHFAARNRLQVALSQAVVVVECPETSGALHSATLAWEQGLPLWVVPADAGKVSAAGSNRLLLRGATPLLAADDLISQLGRGPLARERPPLPGPPEAVAHRALRASPSDQVLLEALGGGASLEQLRQALGLPAQELACRLLGLELAGRIQAEPGLCWRPCAGRGF